MFDYFLTRYKDDVYNKQLRSFKDFTVAEKTFLIVFSGAGVVLFFSLIFFLTLIIVWVAALTIMIVDILIIWWYTKTHLKKESAYEKFSNNLNGIKEILLDQKFKDLCTEDGINFLIKSCNVRMKKRSLIEIFEETIKQLSKVLIVPIIIAIASSTVNELNIGQFASVTVVVGIFILVFYACWKQISLSINDILTKDRKILAEILDLLLYIKMKYKSDPLFLQGNVLII